MFTGLVEAVSTVRRREPRDAGLRLWVEMPPAPWSVRPGQSVAVSGACLTVTNDGGPAMVFDLSAETLERTWKDSAYWYRELVRTGSVPPVEIAATLE